MSSQAGQTTQAHQPENLLASRQVWSYTHWVGSGGDNSLEGQDANSASKIVSKVHPPPTGFDADSDVFVRSSRVSCMRE